MIQFLSFLCRMSHETQTLFWSRYQGTGWVPLLVGRFINLTSHVSTQHIQTYHTKKWELFRELIDTPHISQIKEIMAIPTRGRPITDVVLSVLILMLAGLHSALGAPLTIKYDSVKNLQGSASIGRGYTFSTNSLQSTCMNITSSTISQDSYNYECKWNEGICNANANANEFKLFYTGAILLSLSLHRSLQIFAYLHACLETKHTYTYRTYYTATINSIHYSIFHLEFVAQIILQILPNMIIRM